MRYASVIVDLTAKALDRCFTYAVPDGMEARIGDMVSVPFGKRTVEGFILDLTDETELDTGRIKPIKKTSGEQSVLLPELIDLAGYMKRRYSCTTADALRTMIPAQMRSGKVKEKNVKQAYLAVSPQQAAQTLAKAPLQKSVALALIEGGKTASELKQEFPGADAALRRPPRECRRHCLKNVHIPFTTVCYPVTGH